MGDWLHSPIKDNVAVGDNDTSTVVDLPTSNFISKLAVRLSGTGGVSITTDSLLDIISKAEIIANGQSVIKSLKASDLRRLANFDYGVASEKTESAGAASGITIPINFGRFPWDTFCILPAKLFKTLQLKLEYGTLIANAGFTTGTVKLDVMADELVADEDPLAKFVIKDTELDSHSSAAQTKDVELPLGNRLRRVMIFCTNGQADLTKIEMRINNGALIPWTSRYDTLLNDNKEEYRLATAMTDVAVIDLDKRRTLANTLQTMRLNDLKLRYSEAAGSTIRTVIEELLAFRGGGAAVRAARRR